VLLQFVDGVCVLIVGYKLPAKCKCSFVMVALWNRADHYIFALWFLSIYLSIYLSISAVGDWMSTILPHTVWPQCKFTPWVKKGCHP